MLIKVRYEDQAFEMNVVPEFLQAAQSFFAQMDRDMDRGWQMSRDWIESPDTLQRCQIAADKLASALDNKDQKTATMMAGYLVDKIPELNEIQVDSNGEMSGTEFLTKESTPSTPINQNLVKTSASGLSKMAALTQAGKEVSKVFKVGRGYRHSVYNEHHEQWQDSSTTKTKEEAERLRELAFKERFDALAQTSS